MKGLYLCIAICVCLALLYWTRLVLVIFYSPTPLVFGQRNQIVADIGPPKFENNRPIIGVLSQEITPSLLDHLPHGHNFSSYIAAGYIKYLEGAGARVAPIVIGKDPEEYRKLFAGLNGLLFPGGSANMFTSEYAQVSKILYNLAIEANDRGDFFPVWGTCLGFQMLVLLAARGQPYRIGCDAMLLSVPLEFLNDWETSRLFKNAPKDVIEALTTSPITMNNHGYCLSMENFTKYAMGEFWQPISVNSDRKGQDFISTLEAKKYPIFATQWHPEKSIYEWSLKLPENTHVRGAVKAAFYTAEFFIAQARKSSHQFPDRMSEENALIYNYQPFYSGIHGISYHYQQVYLF